MTKTASSMGRKLRLGDYFTAADEAEARAVNGPGRYFAQNKIGVFINAVDGVSRLV